MDGRERASLTHLKTSFRRTTPCGPAPPTAMSPRWQPARASPLSAATHLGGDGPVVLWQGPRGRMALGHVADVAGGGGHPHA